MALLPEEILYSFQGGVSDGEQPYAGVTFDADGNIYDTTAFGGPYDAGTVFELSRVGQGDYQEKVLWSFNREDGISPLPAWFWTAATSTARPRLAAAADAEASKIAALPSN